MTLENMMLSERNWMQKATCSVSIRLYTMSRIGKSTETESQVVVARWGGSGGWCWEEMGTGFLFGDKNVPELDGGDSCTTP